MQTQAVGYLTTTHLGEQGQMTLPREFRETQHLEPGAAIAVLQFGNQLILIPEQTQFAQLSDALADKLAQAGITEEDLLEGLPATREEIMRERYPELFNPQT